MTALLAPGPAPRDLTAHGTAIDDHVCCHGTALAHGRRAVLLLGPSGAGKSGTALVLMAHGLRLIADDSVIVRASGHQLWLCAPDTAPPTIEARFVGLLGADMVTGPLQLQLVVDLGTAETDRLPPQRKVAWSGAEADLILGAGNSGLWPAVLQYLRGGRSA